METRRAQLLRGRKFTDRTFPTNDALYWADYEYERNERVARLTYEYEVDW